MSTVCGCETVGEAVASGAQKVEAGSNSSVGLSTCFLADADVGLSLKLFQEFFGRCRCGIEIETIPGVLSGWAGWRSGDPSP